MARDVEFNMTASDRTDGPLARVAANFKRTQDKIKRDGESSGDGLGKGLLRGVERTGPKILGSISNVLSTAAQNGGPILAGVGVAAAPLIAGTLGAAIIGGAGIGGVVGGVLLAAKDPRVARAGTDLGDTITKQLTDFAQPFIDPVLRGITTIKTAFGELEGPLRSIFANSAKFVQPLTEGVTRFAQSLVRGLDTLVSRAGPVISAISDGLVEMGRDVNEFLTTISQGSDGAAASVRQLVDLFGGVLAVLGPIITGINKISELYDKLGLSPGILQFIGQLTDAGDATTKMTWHTNESATAMLGAGQAATTESQSLDALNASIRQSVSENVSLYGATTSAKQAIIDSTEAIDKNGRGLALNTERGRENRSTLATLAGALNSQYDAYVKVNGAGVNADNVLRSNRESFIQVARQAGASAGKAKQLANELLGIPDSRKPKVELLDKATGKINNVINRLAAVRDKTVNLTVAVRQSGDASALRKQSAPAFSAGQHFAITAPDAGRSRTGGPTPVSVDQTLSVQLDGQPFYAYTARAIAQSNKRAAWRQKVGART